MITPSYAITATERVLPRLALDFTTGVLDSRVTFTRATSASNPATYIDSTGVIVSATNNQPRFDYDPATLVCKGLLIEESRANLLLQSGLAGAVAGTPGTPPTSWALSFNTGSLGVASYQSIANALTFTIAASREVISQSVSVLANTTYAFSVKVLSSTVQAQNTVTFNPLPAGSTVTGPYVNGVLKTATYVPAANETLVYTIAVAATAGTLGVRIGAGTASNTTGAVTLVLPQLEAGAFATSYIPTTTTALTRNADVATMTGTNFSDWFNASEGTFVFNAQNPAAAAFFFAGSASDGTVNNQLRVGTNGTGLGTVFRSYVGGAVQCDLSSAITLGSEYTACAAYRLNDFAFSTNGGATTTDTSGSVPTVNQLRLGSAGSGLTILNGHLKQVLYYPQRLTDSEVQAFSK